MDYKLIGSNIKTVRKKRHLTQEQLSEMVGISTNFLACIETGVRRGSFETYVNIANALCTTLDTLTAGVVTASEENPLKEDLIYYFDKSSEITQKIILNLAREVSDGADNIIYEFRIKGGSTKRNHTRYFDEVCLGALYDAKKDEEDIEEDE